MFTLQRKSYIAILKKIYMTLSVFFESILNVILHNPALSLEHSRCCCSLGPDSDVSGLTSSLASTNLSLFIHLATY